MVERESLSEWRVMGEPYVSEEWDFITAVCCGKGDMLDIHPAVWSRGRFVLFGVFKCQKCLIMASVMLFQAWAFST